MSGCPPVSPLFCIQDIANAGRGVVASTHIASGTRVLVCERPIAHVIFREYRKEVCAQCFYYDRGRTLPVRDNEIGKVFCTPACRDQWLADQGSLGVDAWQALTRFVHERAKNIVTEIEKPLPGCRPSVETVEAAWDSAVRDILVSKKRRANQDVVDADALSLLLSTILARHRDPEEWSSRILSLAMDGTPYNDAADLERHVNSMRQLSTSMPGHLISREAIQACHDLVAAGSHNAFGIRAGGEDAEEFMGYGVYPSASFFNHSCDPNVSKRRSGQAWDFTTAKSISPGEQLCISYLGGDEKDMEVDQRRQRLEQTWGFVCQCSRCIHEQSIK